MGMVAGILTVLSGVGPGDEVGWRSEVDSERRAAEILELLLRDSSLPGGSVVKDLGGSTQS